MPPPDTSSSQSSVVVGGFVPRQKPLDLLFRSVAQRLRDHVLNAGFDTLAREHGGDEQFALLDVIHNKAAITPATTTGVTGNASNPWAQWSSSLRPSVFSQLVDAPTLALDYTEGGALRVPSRSSTPTCNGSFVGEGQSIPTRRFGLTSTALPAKKVGVIVPFTRELAKSSPLNVEAIVRAEVTADTALAVDAVLLDATAADSIRPAGLRAGVSGLTPSVATTANDKMVSDIKALLAAIAPVNRAALILNPAQAIAWRSLYDADALTVIASASLAAGTLIALDLDSFVSASSLPMFSVSEEAVIHEEDTAPLPIVGGVVQPPVIGSVAAPVRSFFQTAVIGVKLEWPLNWALMRSSSVSWMSGATW